MLQRMRDLKVQYSNETLDASDKSAIVSEAKALSDEISDIRTKTDFNGIKLLNGSKTTISFQVGANAGDTVSATTLDINGASGVGTNVAALQTAAASDAAATKTAWDSVTIGDIDTAINNISSVRSGFGATQNRLEHRLNNLSAYQENLVASESRIRDVDMASEMVNFTKLGILQQAGTSMLAQANQAPQNVLSLLR